MRIHWLNLSFIFATAAGVQAQIAPRFELSADTLLVDERLDIVVAGLPAKQNVTIHMRAGGPARFHSSATFRSDERGPHFPTAMVTEFNRHPISGTMTTAGGTPEGAALASEDSWRKLLQFLDRNLRRRS